MSTARGIVLGALTPDQMIVQATEAEVARFALGANVAVSSFSPANAGFNARLDDLMNHGLLYDREGRAVAAISEIRHDRNPIEITTFGDIDRRYYQGFETYRIQCEGPVHRGI